MVSEAVNPRLLGGGWMERGAERGPRLVTTRTGVGANGAEGAEPGPGRWGSGCRRRGRRRRRRLSRCVCARDAPGRVWLWSRRGGVVGQGERANGRRWWWCGRGLPHLTSPQDAQPAESGGERRRQRLGSVYVRGLLVARRKGGRERGEAQCSRWRIWGIRWAGRRRCRSGPRHSVG